MGMMGIWTYCKQVELANVCGQDLAGHP